MKDEQRFSPSMKLERALCELSGFKSRWNHSASLFANPKIVKSALLAATKIIRKRLREIVTVDDRLLITTTLELDEIDRIAKTLSPRNNSQQEIIACLIHLIARLLGFDWLEGKPNREVVYFQTLEQQFIDDRKRHPNSHILFESQHLQKRKDIIEMLHDQGCRVSQISLVMNISETIVKSILIESGRIKRSQNIKKIVSPVS